MIQDIRMFRYFTEKEKADFAAMNHSFQNFRKGDVVIKEGAMYKSLYLLIKGSVLITKSNHAKPLSRLTAGMIFGEMSFFNEKPRHTNVIAEEDIMVLRIDKALFQSMPQDIRDKIKDYLIETLIDRLEDMNDNYIRMIL